MSDVNLPTRKLFYEIIHPLYANKEDLGVEIDFPKLINMIIVESDREIYKLQKKLWKSEGRLKEVQDSLQQAEQELRSRKAAAGEVIRVEHVDQVQEMKYGGPAKLPEKVFQLRRKDFHGFPNGGTYEVRAISYGEARATLARRMGNIDWIREHETDCCCITAQPPAVLWEGRT
jgi:hypothetical protein